MTFHIVYDNSFDSSLAAAIISAYIKSSDEKNEKTIKLINISDTTNFYNDYISLMEDVKQKNINQIYMCGAYLSFTDISYIYKMIPSKMDLFECDKNKINLCKQYGIININNVSLNENRSIFAQVYDHFYNIDNIHNSDLVDTLSNAICLLGDENSEKIYKYLEYKFEFNPLSKYLNTLSIDNSTEINTQQYFNDDSSFDFIPDEFENNSPILDLLVDNIVFSKKYTLYNDSEIEEFVKYSNKLSLEKINKIGYSQHNTLFLNSDNYCFSELRNELFTEYDKFIQYYKSSIDGGYLLLSFKERKLIPEKLLSFSNNEYCAAFINNEWKLVKRIIIEKTDNFTNEKRRETKYYIGSVNYNNVINFKLTNSITDDNLYNIKVYDDQEFNKFDCKKYLNEKFGNSIGTKNFAKTWINNSQFNTILSSMNI